MMFALVIKEKTGVVFDVFETDGETHEVLFGDYEEDVERATELLAIWSDWMMREIDTVQPLTNSRGEGVTLNPRFLESIALKYTRS